LKFPGEAFVQRFDIVEIRHQVENEIHRQCSQDNDAENVHRTK